MKITKKRLQEIILEELNEEAPPSVLPQYKKEYTGKERRSSTDAAPKEDEFKGKAGHQKDIRDRGATASKMAQQVGGMLGPEVTGDEMIQAIRDVLAAPGTAKNLPAILRYLKMAHAEAKKGAAAE